MKNKAAKPEIRNNEQTQKAAAKEKEEGKMAKLSNTLTRWKNIFAVSRKSGMPISECRSKMRAAKQRYKISYTEYNEGKIYELTDEEIGEKYENRNVKLVAQIKGVSLEEARRRMDAVKEKYGVSYKQYVDEHLYRYTTEEKLKKRLDRLRAKDESYIQNVCDDTGWSYEEAKQKMDEVKKKYKYSYRQYSAYRFFEMTEEEIQQTRERHQREAAEKRKFVMDKSGWDEEKVRKHMRRFEVQHYIPAMDYVMYRAWELSDDEIKKYARMKDSEKIWAAYNAKDEAAVLAKKNLFNEMYKEYLHRKFWVNRDTNYEEFVEFAHDLDEIFCKPITFGGGLGTEKHKVDKDNLKELYDLLMAKDRILVEECVKQHHEIEEFMPGCVNTIRIVVLQDKQGEIHILSAGMKFGNNTIVDNPSKGGLVVAVDEKTGVISTDAIDIWSNVYTHHPVTGKKFKGFQIPNWDMAVKLATDALQVQPGVNYVGWDLAVCEDKAVIIEGNSMPDLVLNQAPYVPEKKGIKYIFEPYIPKKKSKTKKIKKERND